MTDTSDLVERLLAGSDDWLASRDIRKEAATALTAKDKEIEALRDEAEIWPQWADSILSKLLKSGCDPDLNDIDLPELVNEEIDGLNDEICRLKARAETAERDLDEARALVTEANNSLFGSQGYFHSLNGGAFDKYHLSRAIEDLKSAARAVIKQGE